MTGHCVGRSCGTLESMANVDHTDVSAAAVLGVFCAIVGPLIVRRLVSSLAGEAGRDKTFIASILRAMQPMPKSLANEVPPAAGSSVPVPVASAETAAAPSGPLAATALKFVGLRYPTGQAVSGRSKSESATPEYYSTLNSSHCQWH
jgi:hypothetical protein